MALDPKACINQSDNCQEVSVYDTTGEVSASNPDGWDCDANSLLADVVAATVAIYKRNDDGTYTEAPDSPVNIYDGGAFPNIDCTPAVISAETAGYGTDSVWADGIYKFVFTYTLNTPSVVTYTFTKYPVLTCAIECCYKELADRAAVCECNCDGINEKLSDVATYKRLLDGAKECGNLTRIQNYIDYLTAKCADCGCGCSD